MTVEAINRITRGTVPRLMVPGSPKPWKKDRGLEIRACRGGREEFPFGLLSFDSGLFYPSRQVELGCLGGWGAFRPLRWGAVTRRARLELVGSCPPRSDVGACAREGTGGQHGVDH